MQLSFCVPLYNRAGTIERCLDSLLAQTMPWSEYEIIVVDDGSIDGSAEIAEALFATRGFHHGHVYRRSCNSGGASVPRNMAVERAQADYLFFVDSDDYVAPELAQRVSSWAKDNESDVVYVKYGVVGPGLQPPKAFAERGNQRQADIIEDKLLYATMVHKAFRRSRWLDLGIRFDPEIRVYEDMLATVQFLFGRGDLGEDAVLDHSDVRCSVIADQEYYFFVNQAGERLHQANQPLATTFRLWADILDAILGSSWGDEARRQKAAAVIVNRVMQFGPAADHPYLAWSCPRDEVRRWISYWRDLLAHHFPAAADRYIKPRLRTHVRALRHGRVWAARSAVAAVRALSRFRH